MKRIIKELIPYIIIIVVVIIIRAYIVTPVIVVGDSMVPTLEDGQILLLNKLDYKFNEISRYDVVVIEIEKNEIIKRVIGLPGEYIEYSNNTLYINGHEEENIHNFETEDFKLEDICDNCKKIPEGKYLVLGDNRTISSDSRIIGLIDEKDIKGSTTISIWPIKTIK
jgi:signal peptidase I